MSQQHSPIRVTIHFAVFATIAAGMIGLGQGSWNLPLLVGFCSIVSIIYTDRLCWIAFPKWLVFIAMIFGAGVAILGFLSDSPSKEILAVGNLLVYVQLPLMFQKKSIRVYEQWGVFLLLELVVAALVNDKVLYGLLMLPVLALGCASMMALAEYTSQLRHHESISESTSMWARILHWIGKEKLVSKRSSGVALYAPPPDNLNANPPSFAPSRWLTGVLPIAFSVFLFSLVYFYFLPRLNSSSYEGFGGGQNRIGFSSQISLRHIGDMLQTDALAFRMSMVDNRKQTNYRPSQPPYIRVTVSHRYDDGPAKGTWHSGQTFSPNSPRIMQKVPSSTDIDALLAATADSVTVNVIEKSSFGTFVPTIAPLSRVTPMNEFRTVRRSWCVVDVSRASHDDDKKRRYSFSTYAFTDGLESVILPELQDCLTSSNANGFETDNGVFPLDDHKDFPLSLEPILPLRDTLLSAGQAIESDKLTQAILLEEYLANGPDFSYSLSLTRQIDRTVDPIVDFLLNKRKGHCQYFASALALWLRSLDIPTRIVIGFRPGEYNEVGEYFLVQQNHAHAWVEAYFTVDELKSRFPSLPAWVKRGAWLRLDPTPPGEGSNAGGTLRASSGQTLGAIQDLWDEMVLNMDKSKQSTLLSLFGESSSVSYTGIWQVFKSGMERLQNNPVAGVFITPDRWFSWRVATAIILAGSAFALCYRLLLWFFPTWMMRFKVPWRASKATLSKIDFYDRAARALKRLGFERKRHETPEEFLGNTAAQLCDESFQWDGAMLSRMFYARRFGGLAKLSEQEQANVDQSIKSLELQASRRKRNWVGNFR